MAIETRVLGLPYQYQAAPGDVLHRVYQKQQSLEDLLDTKPAVNCLTAAYMLTMMTMGIHLPLNFDTVRLILDRQYLYTLDDDQVLAEGDWVFVGKSGITEFKPIPDELQNDQSAVRRFIKQYPGPHVGWWDGKQVVHASYYDNQQVVACSLDDLKRFPNYTTVYARRRLIR